MKYMGSKARHARELLAIVLDDRKPEQWYVEPFVGGGNMIQHVEGSRIASDYFKPSVCILEALSKGWVPPKHVSEYEYKEVKANQDKYPPHYVGYLGFQLSYGALWFSTFRRDTSGKRDYSVEAYNHAIKQSPKLKGIVFHHCSYDELTIPDQSIIYCDPPYQGTTGYATGAFDHDKFWKWCRDRVSDGHKVFVSEYTAPDDWVSVWEKQVNNTLTKDTGSKKGIERLFVLRGCEPKLSQGALL